MIKYIVVALLSALGVTLLLVANLSHSSSMLWRKLGDSNSLNFVGYRPVGLCRGLQSGSNTVSSSNSTRSGGGDTDVVCTEWKNVPNLNAYFVDFARNVSGGGDASNAESCVSQYIPSVSTNQSIPSNNNQSQIPPEATEVGKQVFQKYSTILKTIAITLAGIIFGGAVLMILPALTSVTACSSMFGCLAIILVILLALLLAVLLIIDGINPVTKLLGSDCYHSVTGLNSSRIATAMAFNITGIVSIATSILTGAYMPSSWCNCGFGGKSASLLGRLFGHHGEQPVPNPIHNPNPNPNSNHNQPSLLGTLFGRHKLPDHENNPKPVIGAHNPVVEGHNPNHAQSSMQQMIHDQHTQMTQNSNINNTSNITNSTTNQMNNVHKQSSTHQLVNNNTHNQNNYQNHYNQKISNNQHNQHTSYNVNDNLNHTQSNCNLNHNQGHHPSTTSVVVQNVSHKIQEHFFISNRHSQHSQMLVKHRLWSNNKHYSAELQANGNFVIFDSDGTVNWSTNTNCDTHSGPFCLEMTNDAVVHIKDGHNRVVWQTSPVGVYRNDTFNLVLSDRGELMILDSQGNLTWSNFGNLPF